MNDQIKSYEKSISELIEIGNSIIRADKDFHNRYNDFQLWKSQILQVCDSSGISKELILSIRHTLHFSENKFSESESIENLKRVIADTIGVLQYIIYPAKQVLSPILLDEKSALIVVRSILNNFHLHIKAMYKDVVHGNGTLNKTDLDKIKLGNEYDVQRMLYSLLKPIFLNARLEVHGDGGYLGIRYDIELPDYDAVIEVKCTRGSMTERSLCEQMGADIYHYKARKLFFYIYDKEGVIKNTDAFKENYTNELKDSNRSIETYITQVINLI